MNGLGEAGVFVPWGCRVFVERYVLYPAERKFHLKFVVFSVQIRLESIITRSTVLMCSCVRSSEVPCGKRQWLFYTGVEQDTRLIRENINKSLAQGVFY